PGSRYEPSSQPGAARTVPCPAECPRERAKRPRIGGQSRPRARPRRCARLPRGKVLLARDSFACAARGGDAPRRGSTGYVPWNRNCPPQGLERNPCRTNGSAYGPSESKVSQERRALVAGGCFHARRRLRNDLAAAGSAARAAVLGAAEP